MAENTNPCPCLSGTLYSDCCQPYHNGKQKPQTAEQLMRSRYTAFYYGEVAYLVSTLHPEKRRFDEATSLTKNIKNTRYLGLKVLDHTMDGDKSTVEFVAFYSGVAIAQQHERSRFVKVEDQWYYYDGDQLPDIKLSRNEPCFCGSGKKYKKCHAIKDF